VLRPRAIQEITGEIIGVSLGVSGSLRAARPGRLKPGLWITCG